MKTDVSIQTLFAEAQRPLLSFEFFPPKDEAGLETLQTHARELLALAPDFVTVTYGAGGSTRQKTFEVCRMLRNLSDIPVMPHLTCVGSSRADLDEIADEIHALGYRNIMTLRGDPPKGNTEFQPAPDGLSFAVELVQLLKRRHPDFCCGVAAYPEVHPEADSPESDLANLKAKIDAGGAFGTTQLFFDNALYFSFVERARAAGITAPILPGLLPALSLKQVQRMCTMCRAALPTELEQQLADAGEDAEASQQVGIEWAARQIEELLQQGAPGIHLYILNRSGIALSPPLRTVLAGITGH
ncbi:MAG: methylenetetrahydrofolate reductase [NAD(P)H] [Verrucomicrobia bacterium]|nr:methylenetetrahydrofolate reductase [NAD(P)H] [Verrucomicrobiota bacterium]